MNCATPTSNAQIVRRWFEEVWGQRKLDVVDDLLVAESVCYAEEGPVAGPEEFKQRVYFPLASAFPDLQIFLDDFLEVGDQVVVRWRAEATHTGDGLGIPPTGRAVELVGITWVRLSNGKLVEGWQSSNIPIVIRELAPHS